MVDLLRREGAHAVLSERGGTSVSVRIDRASDGERVEETAGDWLDPDMPLAKEVRYGSEEAEIQVHGLFAEDGRRVNVVVAGRRYQWRYGVEFRHEATHVNFGMMLKTVDGIDVAGVSSDRELLDFYHIRSGARIEVTFSLRMNVVPAVYFLNAGVGGLVNGKFTYLARRVDVEMIRVIPVDRRPRYGITELEPSFSWEELPG